jgi:regulator of sirC expression with transglutaminase-like and TPR domain
MNENAALRGDFGGGSDAAAFLRELGRGAGDRLPLAEAALALAALDGRSDPMGRYLDHLADMVREVADAAGRAHGLTGYIAALNEVLYQRHGYSGDTLTYEDPDNADLMRVIDRRKGLPVALGILAIHVARAQGWEMVGLALPGHFLVRIEQGGERAILDPFNGGRPRDAAELRELLRAMTGGEAALAPRHYAPVSDRDVLLRLQNNLKLRHLESEQPAQALAVLDGMILVAPEAPRLRHEAGILHAELGNYGAASASLERFLALAEDGSERHRAALLLQRLRLRLN